MTIDQLSRIWPFPIPAGPASLTQALADAARALYWQGVFHGLLTCLVLVAMAFFIWCLFRPSLPPAVKVTILATLLGGLIWYVDRLNKNAPPAASSPTTKPEPATPRHPPRPWRNADQPADS